MSFGQSPYRQQPPPSPPGAPVQTEEEKLMAEKQRLFDQALKEAQEDLKKDRRDVFVRSPDSSVL